MVYGFTSGYRKYNICSGASPAVSFSPSVVSIHGFPAAHEKFLKNAEISHENGGKTVHRMLKIMQLEKLSIIAG